ncbi:MAG TPA: MFS transporter [Herpetosiphonaceae bacterium]
MAWLRRTSDEQREIRRNSMLGLVNGVGFTLGEALSDANLVLTLFIRELGASAMLVGLLPSLKSGGWLLPQLVMAGKLQSWRYKLPAYRRAGLVRFILWSLLTGLVWISPRIGAGWTLTGVLTLYALYNLAGGTGGLAFQEVVAKTIPPRRRGNYFGRRNLLGGLAAFFIAGPIVTWALDSGGGGPGFPANYGLLLAATLICIGPALVAFMIVREPPTESPLPAVGALGMFAALPRILRQNQTFRRFIVARMLTRLGSLADPFYIIYAREVLLVPAQLIGGYLALRTLSAALSNLYWARVVDRQGNRRLMVLTGILIVCVPLWALLSPAAGLVGGATATGWAFGGVFLLFGLSVDGSGTAGLTYVMETAPEAERTAYMGIANTTLGLATFFPVLGGLLVQRLGYVPVFALTALFAALGLALSWRLPEPRLQAPAESI